MRIYKIALNYFKKHQETKRLRKQTIDRLTKDYNDLINEFRLIKEQKSKLSRRERDFVVLRIKHLISKGHIQINK